MASLDNTEWDVVISGTGLPQSLLALALSRSGKKILHLDRNEYYGGDEAAFSLQEAEQWAQRHGSDDTRRAAFSEARVEKSKDAHGQDHSPELGPSRAYSLALAPHLLYAHSQLIRALVSSRLHEYVEFQAVGSFFVLQPRPFRTPCRRVPGSREDIFNDDEIDLRTKRALMKCLRFVTLLSVENLSPTVATSTSSSSSSSLTDEERNLAFPAFLQQRFGLPAESHGPLLALTLSPTAPTETTTDFALRRLERHIRSTGVFGPGFGAVLPKWGALAEIAQVACRACAVGGGVYCLKKGIKSVRSDAEGKMIISLEGDDHVKAQHVVGTADQFGSASVDCKSSATDTSPRQAQCRSISIVSSSLNTLFPTTSESGVTPAGAVVVVPGPDDDDPPVNILVHSSDSGECPHGQCVLYTSLLWHSTARGSSALFKRMKAAVQSLLSSTGEHGFAKVLWELRWVQNAEGGSAPLHHDGGCLILPRLAAGLAVDDAMLMTVRDAWSRLVNEEESNFLNFAQREHGVDEEQ